MAHLKDLQDKFGKRGFHIIALSGESRVQVERFLFHESADMTWPVAIKARNPYGVSGIPHAYLVGHDGKVVWEGHPARLSDDDVEKAVRAIPDWGSRGGSRAKRAGKDLDKGSFGKALRAAQEVLAREEVDPEDREACEAIVAHVEAVARRKLDHAEALVTEGEVARAVAVLEEMDKAFDRTEWAEQASARVKELQRDDRAKALLSAAEQVEKVLRRFAPRLDDDDCEAAKRLLERIQAKSEGDAATWLGRYVEIFGERWTAKRT